MSEIVTRNATIESVRLGYDRGVFLCGWLFLDYGGSGQGFGGYVLWKKEDNPPVPMFPFTGLFVSRVLDVVGCESWEDLPGKSIRVKATYDKVIEIGNYLKDEWFNPGAEITMMRDGILYA